LKPRGEAKGLPKSGAYSEYVTGLGRPFNEAAGLQGFIRSTKKSVQGTESEPKAF